MTGIEFWIPAGLMLISWAAWGGLLHAYFKVRRTSRTIIHETEAHYMDRLENYKSGADRLNAQVDKAANEIARLKQYVERLENELAENKEVVRQAYIKAYHVKVVPPAPGAMP